MSRPHANSRKRRKRSLVIRFWVYRRLVVLAVLLGLILWFVYRNNQDISIVFPFGLGRTQSTTGVVILLSCLVGAIAGALSVTILLAIRRARSQPEESAADPTLVSEELPPTDYAAKTTEGFSPVTWK